MSAADTQDLGQPGQSGQPEPLGRRSDVALRVPADSAYVAVLRTAAAGLGARQEFTIDDIGDLRMAVSEACALVLPQADDGSDLEAEFFLDPFELTVSVSVSAGAPEPVDRDSWAWQVISALSVRSDAVAEEGRLSVSLTLHSGTDL